MAIVSGVLSDLFDIPLLKGLIGEKDMQIGILVGERDYWQGVAQRLQAEAQQTTPEPDTTEPGA